MTTRALALALALACAAPGAAAQSLADALRIGDLVCEFAADRPRSAIEDMVDAPRPAGTLLVYESVTKEAAQVLSTRVPGRREVQVRATGRAVHFIERVGPSVRVTTLTGCEREAPRRGTMTCVRFAARHAWILDARALREPDEAFAGQPSGAAHGRCEPWHMD